MRQLDIHGEGAGAAVPASDTVLLGGAVAMAGTRMRFEQNEEIFGADEPAEYLYKVISGAVRTVRFASDGRRQIVSFHMPGDILGLELGKAHTFSAEAVSACELTLVRRSTLERAASQDITAARALMELTAQSLSEAREHALVLGRKGAGERVAAFLIELFDRETTRDEVDLPMSRADIADYLGLTIETVSRAFTQMERVCAIALPSSRHVVVRNRTVLEQLQAA
jgi:CRP/FNR family nitrogen fixation transcriptional regulator